MTDVKHSTDRQSRKIQWRIDGVPHSRDDIAKTLGVGSNSLRVLMSAISSANVNGYFIERLKAHKAFTVSKDGIIQKHKSIKEVVEITGFQEYKIYKFAAIERYTPEGYKITKEDLYVQSIN